MRADADDKWRGLVQKCDLKYKCQIFHILLLYNEEGRRCVLDESKFSSIYVSL